MLFQILPHLSPFYSLNENVTIAFFNSHNSLKDAGFPRCCIEMYKLKGKKKKGGGDICGAQMEQKLIHRISNMSKLKKKI